MKKLLAVIIFVFDIITGPFICMGVGMYLLIRYTLFNPVYSKHWYDGIVITKDYFKVMIKQFPTLYHSSYVIMRNKVKA